MNNTMTVQETLDILYQLCKEDAVRKALIAAGRQDLIGKSPKALIR